MNRIYPVKRCMNEIKWSSIIDPVYKKMVMPLGSSFYWGLRVPIRSKVRAEL